jgi:hypothetical protein
MQKTESDSRLDATAAVLRSTTASERARHSRHAQFVETLLTIESRRLQHRSRRRAAAGRVAAVGLTIAALFALPRLRERTADEAGPHVVTFSVESVGAARVTVVGEFNEWDARATPMRQAGNGRWEVDVTVSPGRHTYAFVVDDSTWMADPHAARAPERWFGGQRSVLVVGGELE